MTIFEVVDECLRAVNGAVSGLGSKWDAEYIDFLLPQVRSEAISESYNGSRMRAANKTISGDWVQNLDITIPLNNQIAQAKYLRVEVPDVVRINNHTNGAIFVGDPNDAFNFTQAFTKAEVSDLLARGFGQGGEIIFLINGKYWELYGNKSLKSFTVSGIFQQPLDVAGFNPYTDKYPIDVQTMSIIKDLFIMKAKAEMAVVGDLISDDAQTTEMASLKNNIRA